MSPDTAPGTGTRRSDATKMEEGAQSVRTAVTHAVGQAHDAMQSAAAKGEEAAEYVSSATISVRDAVQDAIERRPLTAVAIAAVAGLLVGALYKRH
jgi:ElaB/YqjD/DUF883 family membrane-anchored ribosome-binding protein